MQSFYIPVFLIILAANTALSNNVCKNQLMALQKVLKNQKSVLDTVSEIKSTTSFWDVANQKTREKFESIESRMKVMETENGKLGQRLEAGLNKVGKQEKMTEKLTAEIQYWRTSGKGMKRHRSIAYCR